MLTRLEVRHSGGIKPSTYGRTFQVFPSRIAREQFQRVAVVMGMRSAAIRAATEEPCPTNSTSPLHRQPGHPGHYPPHNIAVLLRFVIRKGFRPQGIPALCVGIALQQLLGRVQNKAAPLLHPLPYAGQNYDGAIHRLCHHLRRFHCPAVGGSIDHSVEALLPQIAGQALRLLPAKRGQIGVPHRKIGIQIVVFIRQHLPMTGNKDTAQPDAIHSTGEAPFPQGRGARYPVNGVGEQHQPPIFIIALTADEVQPAISRQRKAVGKGRRAQHRRKGLCPIHYAPIDGSRPGAGQRKHRCGRHLVPQNRPHRETVRGGKGHLAHHRRIAIVDPSQTKPHQEILFCIKPVLIRLFFRRHPHKGDKIVAPQPAFFSVPMVVAVAIARQHNHLGGQHIPQPQVIRRRKALLAVGKADLDQIGPIGIRRNQLFTPFFHHSPLFRFGKLIPLPRGEGMVKGEYATMRQQMGQAYSWETA